MRKQVQMLIAMIALGAVAGCGPKHVTAKFEPVPPIALHYTPKASEEGATTTVLAAKLPTKTNLAIDWDVRWVPQQQQLAALGLMPTVPEPLREPTQKRFDAMLQEAFDRDLAAILQAKKVEVSDSYDSYDEIPFTAKVRLHYLIKPSIEFTVQDVRTSSEQKSGGIIDRGYYAGEMTVRLIFVEPMTQEVVFAKKAHLKMKSKPYVHAYLQNTDDGSILSLVTKVQQASFQVQDNRRARRNAMLNALYAQTMAKLDALLDPEELRSNLSAVQELKARKRY